MLPSRLNDLANTPVTNTTQVSYDTVAFPHFFIHALFVYLNKLETKLCIVDLLILKSVFGAAAVLKTHSQCGASDAATECRHTQQPYGLDAGAVWEPGTHHLGAAWPAQGLKQNKKILMILFMIIL